MSRPLGIAWVAVMAGCSAGTSGGAPRPPAPPASPPFTSITLERTPCYGTCPVYRLAIRGDGSVVFDGTAHVDSAHVMSRIDADQVTVLARLVEEAQFFTLDDKYVSGAAGCQAYATDAPTVITSITTGERSKRVEHDRGCSGVPARLSVLEDGIDGIVRTWRWTNGQRPR